jgi:hypothetical protein
LGILTVMGVPAFGAPILGTLGFTGVGLFTATLPGPISYVDFDPVAGSTGVIGRGGASGSFTVIPPLSPGTILDIASAPLAGFTTAPPGVPVSVDNFITFPALAGTNLRLTLIPLASCVPTATQQCIGGFQINQNGNQVSATLNLSGEAINGPDTTLWSGTLTAQFDNTNIAQVIAAASNPAGARTESWSGQLTATTLIPEPSSMALIGSALIAFATALRRRRK